MSLEIVTGLLGSQLVRAVASEVATTLACQAIQHAVGSMARPASTASHPVPRTGAPPPFHAVDRDAGTPALRALPGVEVLSAVPGRARLRVVGLRDDTARAAAVVATVQALTGVRSADANPLTGTLLVRYDPAQTALPTIVAALEPPLPAARPLRAAERAPHLRLLASSQ